MSKRVKIVLYSAIVLLVIGNIFQFVYWNYSRMPFVMVLDRETAVTIARAVAVEEFAPIYSPSHGYVERDLFVGFDKSIMSWVVVTHPRVSPCGYFIYEASEVVIRMRDGRILNIGYNATHRPILFDPVPNE